MKKPAKIALISVSAVLAVLVLVVLSVPLWVGPVAACIARAVVPSYTGCEFKLDSISLNPFTGKFRLTEAHLVNPKGYDAPDAFSVGSVSVDVAVTSLLTDTIHVRDISIDRPFVSYVFDEAGSNNFARIWSSVQSKLGPAGEKEETAEEKKGGKKLVIDRLAINGTKVQYRSFTLPIPVPTLTNIGKESGGATAAEIRDSVWNQIKGPFTSVGSGLGAAASSLLGGADGAKSSVDSAKKALGDGAKAVGDGAKDAFKKVGNLFGK